MMSRSKSVKVNCFPGATTADMVSLIQPLIARDPDHIILDVGTNDLSYNYTMRFIGCDSIETR